jgi:hypothetical protein
MDPQRWAKIEARYHAAFAKQPVGSYEIVALLGAGGMGEVYSAKDTKLRSEWLLLGHLRRRPAYYRLCPTSEPEASRTNHVGPRNWAAALKK